MQLVKLISYALTPFWPNSRLISLNSLLAPTALVAVMTCWPWSWWNHLKGARHRYSRNGISRRLDGMALGPKFFTHLLHDSSPHHDHGVVCGGLLFNQQAQNNAALLSSRLSTPTLWEPFGCSVSRQQLRRFFINLAERVYECLKSVN